MHIGNAAHRANPQLGQGADMALLDAMALAHARLSHVQRVLHPQYQSDSRALPWLRDRVLFPASQLAPVPRILSAPVCGKLLSPLASLAPPDQRQ